MTKEMFEEMGLYNVDKWFGKRDEFIFQSLASMVGMPDDDASVYVVTSQDMNFGANVLNHPEYLEKIATELDSDLWILPSSIHEILAIKKNAIDNDDERLTHMIREVNLSTVEPEIWLGKDPLVYIKGSLEVKVA